MVTEEDMEEVVEGEVVAGSRELAGVEEVEVVAIRVEATAGERGKVSWWIGHKLDVGC